MTEVSLDLLHHRGSNQFDGETSFKVEVCSAGGGELEVKRHQVLYSSQKDQLQFETF